MLGTLEVREIDLKTDQNFFELDFIKLGNDWRNSLFLRATRDFKERRRFLKFSQWFGRLDFFAFLLAVSFLLNRWRISLSNQGGDPRLLTTFVGICRETVLMKLSLHFCQATSMSTFLLLEEQLEPLPSKDEDWVKLAERSLYRFSQSAEL